MGTLHIVGLDAEKGLDTLGRSEPADVVAGDTAQGVAHRSVEQ